MTPNYQWIAPKPFAQRVSAPMQLVSREALEGCRNGITRRIKKTKVPSMRKRLNDIRDEIDFLIENL